MTGTDLVHSGSEGVIISSMPSVLLVSSLYLAFPWQFRVRFAISLPVSLPACLAPSSDSQQEVSYGMQYALVRLEHAVNWPELLARHPATSSLEPSAPRSARVCNQSNRCHNHRKVLSQDI